MVWCAQEHVKFTAACGDRFFALAATSSHITEIVVIDVAMECDVGQGLGASIPQPARPSCDNW